MNRLSCFLIVIALLCAESSNGAILKVHCITDEDDLGDHLLNPGQTYDFSFYESIFKTEVICGLWQGPGFKYYALFRTNLWDAREDGIYFTHGSTPPTLKYSSNAKHLEEQRTICKRPITTTTDPKASEEVCIQGAGYVEVSKLQSWKIEEAVNGERQRKTDSNKDKTDIKKIKEVVQGTRMKNLVIKEDTNQRKERPKHKGFNFGSFKKVDKYKRNYPSMHKIQPPGGEGTSELRVCGKSTTNEKEENVTATSTKVLTSEAKVARSLLISIQSWRRNQT
ncbi:hypothetical protein Bca52824_056302 [Brassica carinata]|uniref:S-protein homolog n=1 Tax=Brassica carinata TaxID=52824 RepID=A0A8X7QQ80_BRACI|nr:hypothetical protein Bca52824_056302 [Brassica carinata]